MTKSARQKRRSRRILQTAVAIGSIVPIMAGLMGVVLGPHMVGSDNTASISLDSHYRYLSGLLLGIGIGFLTTLPAIETKSTRFQLLAGIVFIGGISRLVSLITVGTPDTPMLFGLTMELVITPILAILQSRIARENHA